MSGPSYPTHYLTDANGRTVRDLTERESAAYEERLAWHAALGCGIPSLLHDRWKRAKRELHRLTTHEERRDLARWLDLHYGTGRIKAHTWQTIAERDTALRGGAA